MILRWDTTVEAQSFRDGFAWVPVKAQDEVSGRWAWVWLENIRVHDTGGVTFSSLWI